MRFKRPLARRDIVGLSIIAACLGGVAIVGVLLLTGDDETTRQTTTQIEAPNNDLSDPVDQRKEKGDDGSANETEAKPPRRAARRPVPVPKFSAGVVQKGTVPSPVTRELGGALNDGSLDVDELRGTPTVMTAFSSKCDFCGPEARLLQAEWKRWGQRGVLYLGLSVRESADSARVFTDQAEIDFPVVGDQSGQTARKLDISGIPETLFISRSGRIVGRVVGGASIGQLEAGSAAARADRPFGVQQGGARVPLQ